MYQYETIPQGLRFQINYYIWQDVFGVTQFNNPYGMEAYGFFYQVLCREHGLPRLDSGNNDYERIRYFLIHNDEKKAAAKDLIQIVFDNGLIPSFMQSHFSGLKTTLESGLPTVRNRQSGHGQGSGQVVVPENT